jgi:hypothetical protein
LKVRSNYERLRDDSWVTVDADGTMDEVHDQLYQIISAEVSFTRIGLLSLSFVPVHFYRSLSIFSGSVAELLTFVLLTFYKTAQIFYFNCSF